MRVCFRLAAFPVIAGIAAIALDAFEVRSYRGGISGILMRNCISCHRPGGVGRIALDTYERARAFAPEIRDSVGFRKMPPSLAVPGFGEFKNDVSITPSEIEALIHWADSGAPLGPGNSPEETSPSSVGWRYGQPDLILKSGAPLHIPDTPGVECQCFTAQTDLKEPKAVRAIDVIPGDSRVVYHVRVFAELVMTGDHTGKVGPSHDCFRTMPSENGRISLGEWSPEQRPEQLPAGIGRMLPTGAKVVVEIRYQKIGFAVYDRTEVGLYFQPAQRYVHTKGVLNKLFSIPANDWNYRVDARWVLEHELTLLSISPHMHRLGSEMRVTATLPDGVNLKLLWVREYDQTLQKTYLFAEPIRLPKGSRVDMTAQFDNSDKNVRQLFSPPRDIHWGTAETDEMPVAFLEYVDGAL